ncbi:GFA family protein [Oleiagrimonas soli]|uniref:Alanine acetyltransferase n=1 Tax=Oleiagrimonas soli TaxID=1543381 RepID=A0A099CVQ8_9GAMM|nr:GFA family protein [Oleiagrimonas soli]KGI77859.1 alanine acetyltransferase [Oleiagrimonas soli]MBB6183796.1 hypothetical protein [Oleiagrimonas soli]
MKLEGSCHCGRVRFSCEAYAPVPYMHCYCSICRKTAGGGGFAINLGAHAESLKVEGREHLSVYQAELRDEDGDTRTSSGQRHFCRHCGSALWLYDPTWPELVHPHASAIDTPLPEAPERVHIMLDSKPAWVPVPHGPQDAHFPEYPSESLREWHARHRLLDA